MADRALQAAARVTADEFGLPFDDEPPYDQAYWLQLTAKILDRYLDCLAVGLPEEAVTAGEDAWIAEPSRSLHRRARACTLAFLRSLRSGLGGDGE